MIKAFKFRLCPAREQLLLLKQHAGNTRFVWNKLKVYSDNHKKKTNKYPTQSKLQQHILSLKGEYDFLKLSYSQPIQINALRLSRTISNAFKPETIAKRKRKIAIAFREPDPELRAKKLKKAREYAFPRFHKKSDYSDSFSYPQNFKIQKCKVFLPKLGWFNFKKHRRIEGTPKNITVSQDGNQWYVSVTCEIEKELPKPKPIENSNIVGIDVGIKTFATLSDGTTIDNPKTIKKFQKKINTENQKLSRKQRDSKRRQKQCLKLHNLYRKCRNIRENFLHQLSHSITTKYDGIILETLDIQEMLKNNPSAMNRSISDVSWYEFSRQLEYKCSWYGKHFVKIGTYEPTTQQCNVCKNLMRLSLDERIYKCSNCGNMDDRDSNASKNICEEGIKILKSTAGTAGRNNARRVAKRSEKSDCVFTTQEAPAFRRG